MSEALLHRLEGESAVRRLVGLYCDAVNRLDARAASELYAFGAVIQIADGPEIKGKDAIRAGMEQSFAHFDFLRMQCTVSAVDVDGDKAKARLLVQETTHKPGEDTLGMLWGNYEDEYSRAIEGWRFERRRYTLQLRAKVPVAKLQQVGVEDLYLTYSFDP
jgi:uncharacterized protein (TIGR02246 family)